MDHVPENLQVMAWLMGAVVTFIITAVGAIMAYLLYNFLQRVENLFVRVESHEGRIMVLETIEGIEQKG